MSNAWCSKCGTRFESAFFGSYRCGPCASAEAVIEATEKRDRQTRYAQYERETQVNEAKNRFEDALDQAQQRQAMWEYAHNEPQSTERKTHKILEELLWQSKEIDRRKKVNNYAMLEDYVEDVSPDQNSILIEMRARARKFDQQMDRILNKAPSESGVVRRVIRRAGITTVINTK